MADEASLNRSTLDTPWIVVVGASAGGLEALQRFFAAVAAPTQAAFVVIQHLAPDHRSMMAELLARHTALPVHEAVAGERLLADHIYLMPPGVLMTIVHEQLVFEPRPQHGVSLPIDQFLRSLGAGLAEHSIGVVLSGSGSDGSAGAAALRAAGGYVMAQTPETAKFDSMPRSVIAATLVDAVLPPEGLASRVLALTQGRAGRLASGEILDLPEVKPALQRLFESLIKNAGIDFSDYKLPTMMRRIERRMAVLGCASVSDYADEVDASSDECELLRRELLIPVTNFFRDADAFEALSRVLQSALLQHEGPQPLRIWSAGCATGEEAYSLAMLALEACSAVQRWPGVKVFATDVDQRFLNVGSSGSYPAGAAETIAPQRVAQFFSLQDDRLVVKPELRQMVLFARHNLLDDAPFTKMDLVVCRNTLIYFQADAQERVMRRLQYALNPGGLLFLGSSESLGALQADFRIIDSANKLYALVRPVLTSVAIREGMGRVGGAMRRPGAEKRAGSAAAAVSAVDLGLRTLVTAYVPVTLLINPHRQLMHAWGSTERYLRLSSGQPNLDVMRLLPPRLGAVLGNALQHALREKAAYTAAPVVLELDGQAVRLRVVARPLALEAVGEACALISLDELPPEGSTAGSERPYDDTELDRLAALERELAESRLTLQSSIEELEASNEELQATNEELMSSNEELQSTNEELQSVNEELYTVNAEYNAKLDLVSALHADLDGMSRATGIATVFLDSHLGLVRFTPEATLLFRLRPEDVGRSINDFKCQLNYPELLADLHEVLAGPKLVEREVTGPGGTHYLVRVVGYGEAAGRSRRAVLSLIEVTQLRRASQLQRQIDSLPEHVAVLNSQGTIVQVNQAWADFARFNGADEKDMHATSTGVGANYLAVLSRSTNPDAAEMLRDIQRVLAGQLEHLRLTYPCHSPNEERWFAMHVSPLRGSGESGAVVTHLDVTPWVHRNDDRLLASSDPTTKNGLT
jgi:two-component system, chemotaxis family, CheB/CheR fusion protein